MTSRERWLAILNRQRPDRIPTDFCATAEVTARLRKELGNFEEKLHIDNLFWVGAPHKTNRHPVDERADIWGCRRRMVDYGSGAYDEVEFGPLVSANTVDEVHAFRWPSVEDHDFDDFAQQVAKAPADRAVLCGHYEPFLHYCWMRGMEQAMMDLLVEPEIAEAILDHIFDYCFSLNRRMFEIAQGRVDLTYVAEDLGSQTSLLMGLDQIRKFLLPRQKKMADMARSYGVHIFYHTDGAARDVIPDLINVTGIEILNPIQWRCPGMEREGLVRDFGDKIAFHGSIDNQQTLPFGTPEDVRNEVLESIEIYRNARWICASCHNLQPNTPTANIVAMYETVYEHGRL